MDSAGVNSLYGVIQLVSLYHFDISVQARALQVENSSSQYPHSFKEQPRVAHIGAHDSFGLVCKLYLNNC